MRQFLTIAAAMVLLTSCRSTKKIQTAIAKKDSAVATSVGSSPKDDSIRFIRTVFRRIDSGRIDFKTFSAKINVDYRGSEDKKYDVNVNIRMLKDSVIWMSVNAILGIEGLRALITQDSVKLLNKQEKEYIARRIDYLQEVTKLPLDLAALQDIIIGNAVFLDSNIVSYTKSNSTISLLSIGSWFKNLITINEGDSALVKSKLDDTDLSRSRTADLSYSDYENRKGVLFATKRKITVVEKKKLDISLDFKQYEFNGEVSFPFSVPKNYKYR